MTDLTVLVVSGGMFQGLGLLRSLRQSGRIRVVVADAYEQNVTRYLADAWKRVPEVAAGAPFVDALLDLCAEEGVRLVLPATAHELPALAESRERFSAHGVQVAVSGPRLVHLASDKSALAAALASVGLPVLEPLDPECAPLPLIGKPAAGFGSRGILVLRTEAERDRARSAGLFAMRLWQRFLPDCDEFSADFAIGMDGVPGGLGIRRRVRTSGGFSVVSENVEEAPLDELVAPLIEWLCENGGRGLFNVQFLVERGQGDRGGVFVSDVNARFGTSAVHWTGVGASPVLFLCASAEPRLRSEARQPERPWPRRRLVRSLTETWIDLDDELSRRERAVEAVVFDLDDTLIDHKAWILGKLELVARRGPSLPKDFVREAARLLEEGAAPRLFDALAERFGLGPESRLDLMQGYRAAQPTNTPLRGDVLPTLESLKRRGYRLALLTDNPPESQRQKIEAAALDGAFEQIVFAREAGGEKPAPAAFREVARRLGLAPGALAMVGDNPWRDVAGALDAHYGIAYGIRRLGALSSFDERLFRRVQASGLPYRMLDGLQPLLVFLEGRGGR